MWYDSTSLEKLRNRSIDNYTISCYCLIGVNNMALISVTEYANKYGKDPGNIRRMLLCGRLAGYKIGKQWVLDEDEKYPEDNRVKNGKYKVYSH